MINYICRRLLYALLIVVLVSMIVFILIRMLPGDPIEIVVSQSALTDLVVDPEYYDLLRARHGLDKPVPIQYLTWLAKVVRGDFGNSIIRNYNIAQDIKMRVVVTVMLGVMSFIVSIIIGIFLGIISAIRRGKLIDNVVTLIANIGITAPTFWIGILCIYLIGFKLGVLPLYGYTLPWVDFGLCIRQSIMPVFVMALGPLASTSRQMRSSMLDVINQDYIRTAWSKGLNERKVIIKHVIKNSLMPVVTLQGAQLRNIFGGSAVVETLFVIPGMGKMIVDGMLAHDYPVIQAVTLIMTFIVVVVNLLMDLMYGWIDPRIQYE